MKAYRIWSIEANKYLSTTAPRSVWPKIGSAKNALRHLLMHRLHSEEDLSIVEFELTPSGRGFHLEDSEWVETLELS